MASERGRPMSEGVAEVLRYAMAAKGPTLQSWLATALGAAVGCILQLEAENARLRRALQEATE